MHYSTKYIGEGMSAALTGLVMGFILLTVRGAMLSPKVTQQLLTFDHSNFFVYVPLCLHPKSAETALCFGQQIVNESHSKL